MNRVPTVVTGLLLALAVMSHPAVAADGFTPGRDHAGHELVLLGKGTARYAGIFHVYDAALYGAAGSDPARLLASDTPHCLEILYRMDVPASRIRDAAETILARQQEERLGGLRERVDRLHAAYVDVTEDDRYALCYAPGRGTELTLNGRLLVAVPGLDFATAYFGIWLAEEPISAPLREALLGTPGSGGAS